MPEVTTHLETPPPSSPSKQGSDYLSDIVDTSDGVCAAGYTVDAFELFGPFGADDVVPGAETVNAIEPNNEIEIDFSVTYEYILWYENRSARGE
jgi:hypothetical protein